MSEEIVVYGFSENCYKCNATKKGFERKGVPFQFVDLETATPEQTARAEELKAKILAAGGKMQAPIVEDRLTGDLWSDLRPDNILKSVKARV